jgi:hypothetical protein
MFYVALHNDYDLFTFYYGGGGWHNFTLSKWAVLRKL